MNSLSKKKEKMTVKKCKGVDLLSKVVLTKESQYEEVCKKSLMDFHTTHPSGSCTVTKIAPSAAKIKPSVTNEGTGVKPGFPVSEGSEQERDSGDVNTKSDSEKRSDSEHETDENESGFESNQEENEEEIKDDEEEEEDEFVKTSSNDTDDEDETNIKDKTEGDEDKGMDYTTNQFDDDVNVRLNEPVTTDEGFIQKEGTDAEMTNKTKVPVTSSSHSSDLASKFLNFSYKDKNEDPFAGSDRGLKKRKTNKDAEPTKGPKSKESKSHSSKGTKSQSTSSRKFVHAEELEFEVADFDMPQDQEENLGNDDEEPMVKVASKRDWFTKPKQPQEPTDPDWNVGKTPQQGPTQSRLMTLASFVDKPSKTFDELISTPIDFSAYIMNDLKITNLTQETLLGPAFKLLKGTRFNYAKLEYDFEKCYKALSRKLDWDNPEGGDYPFDLTKPLPLVMNWNHQMVPVEYFFNNDLKYLQGVLDHDHCECHQKHGYSKESRISSAGSQKLPEEDQQYPNEVPALEKIEFMEKKRANIMIKAIDKQLKERRMMRILEKFVGERHYRTDLRLLQ
nr:hypothetical protein [Tanacetum cinerariifolium]